VPWKPLGHVLNAAGGVGAEVNCPSTTPRFFSREGAVFFQVGQRNFMLSHQQYFFKTA